MAKNYTSQPNGSTPLSPEIVSQRRKEEAGNEAARRQNTKGL